MAILSKEQDYFKTIVGWYGSCESGDCEDFDLSNHKNDILSVLQWSETGYLRPWKSTSPDRFNRFSKLECGKLYYITLQKGDGTIDIPNLTISTFEKSNIGMLVSACDPTPTPVILPTSTPTPMCECDLSGSKFTTVKTTNKTAVFNSHTFSFVSDVEASFETNNFTSANGSMVMLFNSSNEYIGTITFTQVKPINCKFVIKIAKQCYSGFANSSTSDGDNYRIQLSLDRELGDNCEGLPTPTPLSADPTPTPQLKKLEFRWHSVQGREILQVKNILKPTNSNFASRDTFSTWSTLYGFVADSSFYSLDHATWPDASVDTNYESVHNTTSFDGLNFSFGEAENSNGVDYIQLKLNGHISNKTEFLPKVNVSTPCDLFIFAGDNNDPNNSATLDNDAWPVIAKQLEATPTPKPTSDCSPETHTTFHAPAKGETYAYTYTYPDTGKVTTFFTVQGFTNGKVAIDVSLPSNWSENSLATKYYVYLPEGNIIGTVQKMLINQSNMFYYMSSEKCYYGELTGSSTRIDLKEKDGYVAPDACCESNSLKLQVSGGKTSSAVDTITVQADPLGSMDGTLCWPEIGGYTTAQQYNVKFEDAPSDRSTIVINVQNNVSNVKFRYEHKSGSCFEGYLISTGTSTFKKI